MYPFRTVLQSSRRKARRRPAIRVCAVAIAFMAVGAACAGSGGSEDLSIQHVHGLAVDGDTLYVATHHGLYVRDASEWSRRSEDKNDHMGFSYLSPRLMFRSGHPESGGNLGVQRSTDGGRSWELMSNVLDAPVDFHAMAAAPSDPPTLYGWSQTLFRSTGDATKWNAIDGAPNPLVAMTAPSDGNVYATSSTGLYRSKDSGEKWARASKRLFFALASSADGDVLYASNAQEPGVLRSTDGGRKWTDVGEGLDATGVVVALGASRDGRTVVAADQEAGIWMSTDRGGSWSVVPLP